MNTHHTVHVAGLLFDNDGVLIDSTAAVEGSWRAFASWYDLPEDELLSRVHGRRSREVIDHYADQLPVTPQEAYERYIDACVRDFADVDLLPGAAELVAALPPARVGCRDLGGTEIVTQARWRASGLRHPPELITAADVSQGKPNPDPYRIAAGRLRLDPADCLVIEDAPAGLAAASAAGCKSLALLTTHQLDELDADLIAVDLTGVRVSENAGFDVSVYPPPA